MKENYEIQYLKQLVDITQNEYEEGLLSEPEYIIINSTLKGILRHLEERLNSL